MQESKEFEQEPIAPETDADPAADGRRSTGSNASIFTNLPARGSSVDSSQVPPKKSSVVQESKRSRELSRDSMPFFVDSEKDLKRDDSELFLPRQSKSDSGRDGVLGIHQSSAQRVRDTYHAVKERLQAPVGDGPSIYDRLKAAVKHVVKTSDKTAYNAFEQILKSQNQPALDREAGNAAFKQAEYNDAKISEELFKTEGALEERVDAQQDEETGKSKIPNLLRIYPYLRNAGINRLFSRETACALSVAAKKLLDNDAKVLNVKFWGIIYGAKADYYVLEAEAEPHDDEEEEEQPEAAEEIPAEEEAGEMAENDAFANLPPIPKPMLKPLPALAKEPNGTGVNTKAYFIANKLDGNWTRLPPVTPDQVIIARRIQRGFIGDLNAKVPVFPAFPGTEAHYLHAQLARISSTTHICPNGYYLLESDEDVEEGVAPSFNLTENPEYQAPTMQQLSQPHMKFWTHYGQYILRQGRTFFYDAFEANKEEDEEEEAEEDEEGEAKAPKPKYPLWYPEKADWYEPEQNVPPPLCSVMSDIGIDGYPPWSIHFGSRIFPSQSFLILRSNLWPGAVTILYNQGNSSTCISDAA
ncbi:radial spoke head protein 6 homolog A-like isoform X2 [Paramacrobiotus metropolitanus]|uniref:radial spoke head protein 6 homolog A-like isoform X2 n=1 Tax=Paramacrobiotus metropolitanus TaxID=2943436 RepID=UPI002445903C|nr:radial spoke head protein 6 homolog A-like isoform X2 [Paramacrobiotus metropolitanus]